MVDMKRVRLSGKLVKVRLRNIGRGPIEMTILPGKKVIFNEKGITEVDEGIANILLGPGYVNYGYELVKEELTKETKPERLPKREGKETSSKENFLNQVSG